MLVSIPEVEPTNSMAARACSSSATQSAGIACPPVPPPAINTRNAPRASGRGSAGFGLACSLTVLRYAVEDSPGGDADKLARAAVTDKRQRHPRQRNGAHGRPDIEARLDRKHRGQPRRQASAHN